MALLFDLTGVWNWPYPVLSGIQRVEVHVLGELLRSRTDVSLVRYDQSNGSFVPLSLADLPEAVLKYGNLPVVPNRPVVTRIDHHIGAGRPHDSAKRHRPRSHLLKKLVRRAPDDVQIALLDFRASLHRLIGVLRNWLINRAGKHAKDHLPAPNPPDPVFASGDIVLCLSLNWFHPGYWDALASARKDGTMIVQLIHDIGFITHPEWVAPQYVPEGIVWFGKVTANADLLLVTSRFQQAEIETYTRSANLRLPPLSRVRLGDDPPWLMKQSTRISKTTALPQRSFVLNVSGFYVRKNHYSLYHVWRKLAQQRGDGCPDLVLVGTPGPNGLEVMSQILADALTRDRVHVLSDAGDVELADLYRNCLFTVYPSYYEGWGLPVGESLRLGRYCIASSSASIPEVGGDFVDYFDPFDHSELLQRVTHALDNPGYVRAREAQIRRDYRPWSWSATGRQISELADEVRNSLAHADQL